MTLRIGCALLLLGLTACSSEALPPATPSVIVPRSNATTFKSEQVPCEKMPNDAAAAAIAIVNLANADFSKSSFHDAELMPLGAANCALERHEDDAELHFLRAGILVRVAGNDRGPVPRGSESDVIGYLQAASADLSRYLELRPDAEDADRVRAARDEIASRVAIAEVARTLISTMERSVTNSENVGDPGTSSFSGTVTTRWTQSLGVDKKNPCHLNFESAEEIRYDYAEEPVWEDGGQSDAAVIWADNELGISDGEAVGPPYLAVYESARSSRAGVHCSDWALCRAYGASLRKLVELCSVEREPMSPPP